MSIRGVVLVTGSGGGIGRAVAERVATQEIDVLVCADLDVEAAQGTAALCRGKRSDDSEAFKTVVHSVDIRNENSVDDLFTEIVRTQGRIDILLNTAGFGATNQTPIRNMSLADWRSLDDVHNIGSFLLTRAALRAMDSQDATMLNSTPGRPPVKGVIVVLTSLASEGTFSGVGNYIAAKHAVKGMVQTAAVENAARGIRINAVAPSYVSGPMIDQYVFCLAVHIHEVVSHMRYDIEQDCFY